MQSDYNLCEIFEYLIPHASWMSMWQTFSFGRWKDPDEGQIQSGVQRRTASGAGERISFQSLHHHQKEGGARCGSQPIRTTGVHMIIKSFLMIKYSYFLAFWIASIFFFLCFMWFWGEMWPKRFIWMSFSALLWLYRWITLTRTFTGEDLVPKQTS